MGTRSTITFYSSNYPDKPLVTIYHHYDGYISGVGHQLAEWLLGMKLINGISELHHYRWMYANGVGCLVSKFIHDFKSETGNLYIDFEDVIKDCDYNYYVYVDQVDKETDANDAIMIKVANYGNDKFIFTGKPSGLLEYKEDE